MAAGYGRDTYGSGDYGEPTSVDITVSVTGVAGTGAVGSVTITEGSGVTVSAGCCWYRFCWECNCN